MKATEHRKTDKAEHGEHWSQALAAGAPNENAHQRAHTSLAARPLDRSQCGKGSGNTLGKVRWV